MNKIIMKMMISDIIFKQYKRNKILLSCIFVLTEIIIFIIDIFLKLNWNGEIIIWICLLFLILNDIITDCTYNKAKKTLDEIFKESEEQWEK